MSCTHETTKITDTRAVSGVTYRRRVCQDCKKAWWTLEVMCSETIPEAVLEVERARNAARMRRERAPRVPMKTPDLVHLWPQRRKA